MSITLWTLCKKNGTQIFESSCINKIMEQNIQRVLIFGPCLIPQHITLSVISGWVQLILIQQKIAQELVSQIQIEGWKV